jgi:hypothetical protein
MEIEAKSPTKKKLADTVSAVRLDRAFKVFDLRKGGGSLRSISQALKKQDIDNGGTGRGFSHTQVKADFDLALAIKTEDLGDEVTKARILTAERLDDVYLRIAPLLNNEKPKTKISAANVLIRANKEYAELHGAKKPAKLELTGEDGSPLVPAVTPIIIEFTMDVKDDKTDE